MKVVLVPCGSCEWTEEGRLLGRTELPLSTAGAAQCAAWAEQLHDLGIKRVLHAPDELAADTATRLAARLGASAKAVEELSEVDVGLWVGLNEEQLRSRYPSAHEGLCETPLAVQAPGGESLAEAAERVRKAILKQVRKNGVPAVAVVLRPLSLALAAPVLRGEEPGDVLAAMRAVDGPVIMELQE